MAPLIGQPAGERGIDESVIFGPYATLLDILGVYGIQSCTILKASRGRFGWPYKRP